MTKEILKAIRNRCSEVSEGPWEDHNWDVMERPHVVAPKLWDGKSSCNGSFDLPCTPGNAAFIAHSREDLPKLLDALEAGIKALEIYAVGWSGGVGNHAEHHERQYAEIRATRAREALAAIDRIISGEK